MGRVLKRIDLRHLILIFAVVTALVTFSNNFYAAWRVQRQTLIEADLEANRVYAARVASSVQEFLTFLQRKLAYSAQLMATHLNDPVFLAAELAQLKQQDDSFNSVMLTDAKGRILMRLPAQLDDQGEYLQARVSQTLLSANPRISDAFQARSGHMVVFVSQPLISATGEHLGQLSGSIYLKDRSILNNLLTNHAHANASYDYVVDSQSRMIYHAEPAMIGKVTENNPAIAKALAGERGSMALVNFRGTEMLAGYASVPVANWAVISQRPLDAVLEPLNQLMWRMLMLATPLSLLGFLAIWWCARLISQPLHQLAESAASIEHADALEQARKTPAWYFEAAALKSALLKGASSLHGRLGALDLQANTDALTGLLNRHAMNQALGIIEAERNPVAIVSLDIDHFKRVNDSFGHDVGDLTLASLAKVLKQQARADDLVCRAGGEEFLVLLPQTSLETAAEVSERFRAAVEACVIETVGHITISLGVTVWPRGSEALADALKRADELMYQAKHQGRNRVVVG